jgi:outer membrane protein assembly factor BamB
MGCLVFVSGGRADDWPQFRGPNRDGISAEKNWLDHWPNQGPAILWTGHTGLGFSSVVVGSGRLFTLGHADEMDTVYCFEALTGKSLWKYSYPSELGDKFYEGGVTGTPTIDGDRVFVLNRWGDLFCFEAASGKIVWQRNIQTEEKIRLPDWGFSGAPVVHENMLLLNVGQSGMALDKSSGKTLWLSQDKDCGYSTPLPMQREGRWFALFSSREGYSCADLATGKELWRMKWLTQYGLNAAQPIPKDDLIFISSGYGKGAAVFRPHGQDQPEVLWQNKNLRTQFNSAVLIGDFLYGVDGDTTQKAALKCIEFKSGEQKWAEPGIGSGGLTVADGKLIVLTATGELIVAPATEKGFVPTARAQVIGGKCWTVPVLANGTVYCRNSRGDIAAVDLRKK